MVQFCCFTLISCLVSCCTAVCQDLRPIYKSDTTGLGLEQLDSSVLSRLESPDASVRKSALTALEGLAQLSYDRGGKDAFELYVGRLRVLDETTGELVWISPTPQDGRIILYDYAAKFAKPATGVVMTTLGEQLYASDPEEPLGWPVAGRFETCAK